ncbi:protein ZW2 [Capsicum chacoense]
MPPAGGSTFRSSHDDMNSFVVFLEDWMIRQEQILEELLLAAQDMASNIVESQEVNSTGVMRDLISRVLAHYQEYYEEKSRMTRRNVFQAFSPPWFTQLERTFLWIAGFKPGLAFTLVTESVNDLSENQVQMMNLVREETKVEEKRLMEELAKIQESVTGFQFVGVAGRTGVQLLNTGNIEAEMDELKTAMEIVVMDADRLRTGTANRVVGLLNPLQSLRFLTAAAQLQLMMRRVGKQKEAESQQNNNNNNNEGLNGR